MPLDDGTEIRSDVTFSEKELKMLQEKFMDENFRNDHHSSLFDKLSLELRRNTNLNASTGEKLQNIFRILRNCCVQCHRNQNALLKTDIPNSVLQLLSETTLMSAGADKMLSCGLQFLGNFTAGNLETQTYVFSSGFPNLFTCHLTEKYSSLNESRFKICSMVLYNCLDKDCVGIMLDSSDGLLVIKCVCEALTMFSQLDWVVLSVSDYFLQDSRFIPFVLSKCSLSAQCQILGIYCDMVSDENNCGGSCDNISCVLCLISYFLERFKNPPEILTDDFLSTFAMMLKTLCWMTANITPKQLSESIDETEFIDTIVELLSLVGGSNGNSTEIQHNRKIIAAHLSSSFGKRDLVRLIGNLCFDNPVVQNQIRSLGEIPLVLQACSIDDNNPFMQQWAVFAIRNLCRNNPPNQAEIAKLEKLGVADSPVLKSMGLTAVEDESGKLRVVPNK